MKSINPPRARDLRNGDHLPDTPYATDRIFIERPLERLSEADIRRLHAEGKPVPMVSFVVGKSRSSTTTGDR